MNFLIKNIKKITKKILNRNFKNAKKKIVYYSNIDNLIFGDISLNLSTLSFIKKSNQIKFGFFLGNILKKKMAKYIKNFKIVNNFLNIYYNDYFYYKTLDILYRKKFSRLILSKNNKKYKILIDFSSPNSNKPLHIGHLRNILIGNTLSNIYKHLGYNVIKSQIINDRGIHICKCILYYKFLIKKYKKIKHNKGDHFVGKLYLKFENKLDKEIKYIAQKYNIDNKSALKKSKLFKLANLELINWENNKKETLKIWEKLNKLVYKGFKYTYEKLGINFNEVLYESKTYLLGKKIVYQGLKNDYFKKDKDGSIYYLCNNKKNILLRKNGTSLYLTQELGTFLYRVKKNKNINFLIYVVGNEQKEHFDIFFNILKKMKIGRNIKLHHLSYNTVNYFGKKIKSRRIINNSLIYIDYLIKKISQSIYIYLFKKKKYKKKHIESLSLASIKYEFLKTNPNKIINFNIYNILNLKGNTGIYIQYTYARILSIFNKNSKTSVCSKCKYNNIIENNEKLLIKQLIENRNILKYIIKTYDTSIIINYIYKISKTINNFYNYNQILNIKNKRKKEFRLIICKVILKFLHFNMKILGIPILKKI